MQEQDNLVQVCSELNCLLKYFPNEYIDRLPKKFQNFIEKNYEPKYYIKINMTKKLEEQEISKKTKDALVLIKYLYWSDELEKKEIIEKLNENQEKFEKEQSQKYDIENLFNKKTIENTKTVDIIEYKETFFEKIKNWIKCLKNKIKSKA